MVADCSNSRNNPFPKPHGKHMEVSVGGGGMIEAEMTYFGLHAAVSVYARLEKGEIQGRAVFVPV